jgi:tight adherence protein C
MEVITTVSDWVSNPANQYLIFLLMVGATIAIFAMGLSVLFVNASNPIKKRIGVELGGRFEEDASEPGRRLVDVHTLIGPVAHWLIPSSEIERNDTIRRLTHAGYRAPNTLESYYLIKGVLTIALPAIALFATRFFPEMSGNKVLAVAGIAAFIGMIGPGYVLDKLVARRMKALRDGFPDALDLLVVCVESGLGLAAAIERVAREIVVSHSELGTELALVNAEMRAGVDRSKAMRNLADRTGLDDIRGLVSMLIQAMRFGTSIAETLRIYSEEFRDRRMQKAEETAATIGTRLIFPLVFCLFPSFFTVAIGPAVIRFIDVFAQM